MNKCIVKDCPMVIPNEPRSGFYKIERDKFGVCHTHWWEVPGKVRAKCRSVESGTPIFNWNEKQAKPKGTAQEHR